MYPLPQQRFGQARPVDCGAGDRETLSGVHSRALGLGLRFAVFTRELFATGNDADNRASVAAVPGEKLDLVGLALHGPGKAVDRVLKGATPNR